ncbi:MAG TPA: hypothetical protein VN213_20225 [Solirubrobacteraceae bacterium]|nr:hypothetical protein [Solirubrobacteraceae bacterium]
MADEQQHRVSPRYWSGARRGWNDREKLLGLYLLTCAHRNTEGLYHLPKGYIATDLGWTPRQVDETIARVTADGLALYDPDAEVVLLPKALKRQRPNTPLQIRGAVRRLALVPDSPLWEAFLEACDQFAPRLANAIREPDEPPPDDHGNTHGNTHGDAQPNTQQAPMGMPLARIRAQVSSSSSNSSSSSSSGGAMSDEGLVDAPPLPSLRRIS